MQRLRLGILFSTSGPYGALGRDCRVGAELAVTHLHEDRRLPFRIDLVFADPDGIADRYIPLADRLMRHEGCRHVLGTVTSQARKDVIPIVEKHDGQLWYVCPYEGFEANESVIYTGACPNQHLLPLFDILLPRFGSRVFLAGANYVWGWEMNRLARELVAEAGGEVVGERCLPIEETDVSRLLHEVETRRPSFILSNLIGPSSHAFLRGMKRLAERDPRFGPEQCPVVSCDLTECELAEIGLGLADGQLSTASYFGNLKTPENLAFLERLRGSGLTQPVSSFLATSYATVRLLAEAAELSGSDEPGAVRKVLHGATFASVLGPLAIDSATNHAALPFHLGRIAGDGFTVVESRPAVAADPYLSGRRAAVAAPVRPLLRVV